METLRPRRGRPRKYGRPSRAVTVTLPVDVLAGLEAIDADLGRAIVRLAERGDKPPGPRVSRPPAELAAYGNHAVILVNPTNALKRLAGVQLVPIDNGRALISLERPNSVAQLELSVLDALARGPVGNDERRVLEAIVGILQQARRSPGVTLAERTIIVLESKHRRAGSTPAGAAKAAAPIRSARSAT